MSRLTVDSAAGYALYWLAVNRPDVLDDARRFGAGSMLANDQRAARDVKQLLADHHARRGAAA